MTEKLGHKKYGAQGGAWGAYLSSRLAYLYPDSLVGIYLSYLVGALVPHLGEGAPSLFAEQRRTLEERENWSKREVGV